MDPPGVYRNSTFEGATIVQGSLTCKCGKRMIERSKQNHPLFWVCNTQPFDRQCGNKIWINDLEDVRQLLPSDGTQTPCRQRKISDYIPTPSTRGEVNEPERNGLGPTLEHQPPAPTLDSPNSIEYNKAGRTPTSGDGRVPARKRSIVMDTTDTIENSPSAKRQKRRESNGHNSPLATSTSRKLFAPRPRKNETFITLGEGCTITQISQRQLVLSWDNGHGVSEALAPLDPNQA